MIKIITRENCTIGDLADIMNLCSENRHLENFSDIDWENNPKCLVYKLMNTDIFSNKNGAYILVYENNKLAHMSGFNKSDFDENIYICGVRTLTRKTYQHKLLMSKYMLPIQTEEVRKRGGKMMIFCFENGGSLFNVIKKGKFNLFLKNQSSKYDVYKDLTAYDNPVYINHTKHYVLYKQLDDQFNFDWGKINYDLQE